jgi:hypothetical protein
MNTHPPFVFAGLLALATAIPLTAESIVARWTFSGDSLLADLGAGRAEEHGGTMSYFGYGATYDPDTDRGWWVWNFSAQSQESGTRGVVFFANTVGFTDLALTFQQAAGDRASRWARLDYTLDAGLSWTTGFWDNEGALGPGWGVFQSFSVDLSSITGANHNPSFGVRLVSIFAPDSFDDGLGNVFWPNSAYQRARERGGLPYNTNFPWVFDNVVFTGTAIVPEPAAFAVWLGLATAAVVFVRRRRLAADSAAVRRRVERR